jgi:hypothetical protein
MQSGLSLPLNLKPQFSSRLGKLGTHDQTRNVTNVSSIMSGHVCRVRSVTVWVILRGIASQDKLVVMSAEQSIISEVHVRKSPEHLLQIKVVEGPLS